MALLALVIFVPLAVVARLLAGRVLRPGAVFAAVWLVVGAGPAVYYGDSWGITARALAYLATGAVLFSIGALVASGPGPTHARGSPGWTFRVRPRVLVSTVIAGMVAAIMAGLAEVWRSGLSASAVLSLPGLINTGHTVAVDRYRNMATESLNGVTAQPSSIPVSIMLGVAYTAALVAPFLLLTPIRWRRLLIVLLLVSMGFYSIVTTAHSGLMAAVMLIGCGYVAMYTLRHRDVPRVTGRRTLTVGVLVAVLLGVMVSITTVRIGRIDDTLASTIKEKVETYAVGHLPAFSRWLEDENRTNAGERPLGWGTASIAGVGILVGQDRYALRGYEELEMVTDTGSSTNIHTIYRGLIVDYGQVGALAVIFFVGYLMGTAYRLVVQRGSPTAAGALASCYVIVISSYGLSALTWTNKVAAMVLGILILGWAIRPVDAPADVETVGFVRVANLSVGTSTRPCWSTPTYPLPGPAWWARPVRSSTARRRLWPKSEPG